MPTPAPILQTGGFNFSLSMAYRTTCWCLIRISTNSWEEAVNTLRLMRERNWERVLVVSDPPHLRGLDWAWGKVFEGSGKEYRLIAAPLEGWDPERWWQNDASARFVVSEVKKLAYY